MGERVDVLRGPNVDQQIRQQIAKEGNLPQATGMTPKGLVTLPFGVEGAVVGNNIGPFLHLADIPAKPKTTYQIQRLAFTSNISLLSSYAWLVTLREIPAGGTFAAAPLIFRPPTAWQEDQAASQALADISLIDQVICSVPGAGGPDVILPGLTGFIKNPGMRFAIAIAGSFVNTVKFSGHMIAREFTVG